MLTAIGPCQESSGPAAGQVRERWYVAQPGYGRARPAILNTMVFFGTGDGQVIARDANSGVQRWSAKTGADAINGANLIARSGVVVASAIRHTVGIDAQTGRELWRYNAPNDTIGVAGGVLVPGSVFDSRLDADDELVYVPAWGASVSALDLHTGAPRWVWHPGHIDGDTATSRVFRSGAVGARVSGDTLFATLWHYTTRPGGTSEAWVVALDRATGKELWRIRLPYQGSGVLIQAAPVVYQNLVIVHTLSARTYAIDRTTQKVVWEFTVPSATLSTIAGPELYGDAVYVDGGDQHAYALSATDGHPRWSAEFETQTTRDLLVSANTVTFTNGLTLYVLDRQTGRRVAAVTQPRTADSFFASPALFANGQIFVTVGDAAWCFDEP
jgi:eukaryotic-like serine/threonine-protein kinase